MSSIDATEPVPLIVVEGFLGGNWFSKGAWHSVEDHINVGWSQGEKTSRRRVIDVSVGPISSLHDRACELYYAIRGGTVDYGVEHSESHRHARFGRTHYTGIYPSWSSSQPLHFLGHSIGGCTITKMQHLMSIGHFGKDAHPDMLLSINSIATPFRGTQAVYLLGQKLDSRSNPGVHRLSPGGLGAKLAHLVAFIEPIYRVVDLHTDARSLSYRDLPFSSFLKQLFGTTEWTEGRDAAPHDVTFQAADDREAQNEGKTFPNTFYQSHVFSVTKKVISNPSGVDILPPHHEPSSPTAFSMDKLHVLARSIGRFDFERLYPLPKFYKTLSLPLSNEKRASEDEAAPPPHETLDETYWANDGVVPVFSQYHPLSCCSTKCRHRIVSNTDVFSSHDNESFPVPGQWDVRWIKEPHTHSFLVPPPPHSTPVQALFWENIGRYLTCVDSQSARSNPRDP